jgi:carboxyl-terminal processing protease
MTRTSPFTSLFTSAVAGVLGAVLLTGCTTPGTAAASAGAPPACAQQPPPQSPDLKPTTAATLEHAYRCVFARYYAASKVDHRDLLVAAFASLTQELQRRGIDRPSAAMPAMTGDRDRDWDAIAAVYQRVEAEGAVRQALAEAVMEGMVAALDDAHARWVRGTEDAGGGAAIGITGLSGMQGLRADPAATAPLFVTEVAADGPAARKGVRPGDVIVSVNGVPPFIGGALAQSVVDQMGSAGGGAVRLALSRPSTGRQWTVSIEPRPYPEPEPSVRSELLDGDVAYVRLPGFFPGVADQALRAVNRLREDGRRLRGLGIDLRGHRGGYPGEATRLLGGLAHGKTTGYQCAADGSCEPTRTDDTVPLLGLRPVVLTDRVCASACDAFSAAVKGLRLGPLVGTRTAGVVSGPALSHVLNDGSVLLLTASRHLGPGKEVVDTIGVAADHHVPRTALDLSTGRDPALTKALSLLP